MADSSAAVWTILAGDATLAALISAYDGRAAIFTSKHVPDDAARPYIWCPPPISVQQLSGADHTARGKSLPVVQRDIIVVCDAEAAQDPDQPDTIARRVHALCFRDGVQAGAAPSWSDATHELLEFDVVDGPVDYPADDRLDARVVTIEMKFRAT